MNDPDTQGDHAAMLALLAYVPLPARQAMVRMYRHALEDLVGNIGVQLAQGETATLVAAVHKLAGSAAMMQDQALSQPAREMERQLREGTLDAARALWPAVRAHAAGTRAALDAAYPPG